MEDWWLNLHAVDTDTPFVISTRPCSLGICPTRYTPSVTSALYDGRCCNPVHHEQYQVDTLLPCADTVQCFGDTRKARFLLQCIKYFLNSYGEFKL
jgi:hypothetical protein